MIPFRVVDRKAENDRILAISNCFATPVTWSSSGRSIGYLSGCSRQEFATEMWVVNVNDSGPIRQLTQSSLMSLQWSPLPITETPLNTFTSLKYQVRFSYPSNWQNVNDERYEGEDGFFQLSALSTKKLRETSLSK